MRDIKIVATTNLNANLVKAKLLPLLALREVREIVWVSDNPGPPLPRVRYVYIRRGLQGDLPRLIWRSLAFCWTVMRVRPRLVMGFNLNPHGLLCYLVGRLTGRRVCIHLIAGVAEVADGGYRVDPHVTRPSRALERLYLAILRRTDAIVVVGNGARRYLVEQGVNPRRIHAISSKVDPARFRPLRGVESTYDLVIAAALIPLKRVDLFLRIVADLKARFPDIKAAVLGDGPMRAELEKLARELGLGDRVHFLGHQDHMEEFYNRASVFVLTSNTEGLSLAMMEAMACGLPVVVPDVGDLGELTRTGETGFLVPPQDQAAFVEAITLLLSDDALRQRLGECGLQAVRSDYTLEAGVRAWRDILKTLN